MQKAKGREGEEKRKRGRSSAGGGVTFSSNGNQTSDRSSARFKHVIFFNRSEKKEQLTPLITLSQAFFNIATVNEVQMNSSDKSDGLFRRSFVLFQECVPECLSINFQLRVKHFFR